MNNTICFFESMTAVSSRHHQYQMMIISDYLVSHSRQ